MSSEELNPRKWLAGRGQRRIQAVEHAYGVLGLDYGIGHLDNLYLAAYRHALRDAYAFTERQAQAWLDDQHGAFDPEFLAQSPVPGRRPEDRHQ